MKLKIVIILVIGLCEAGTHSFADVAVGVKNFRQLFDSYVVITGVNALDTEVQQTYQATMTRLPKDSDVEQLTTPMVLGVASLGGVFCKKMIANDAAKTDVTTRRAHTKVDFTKGPADLSDEIKKSVITEYAGLFWQRTPTDEEQAALLEVFSGAATGTVGTPAETTAVLRATCASVASSLNTIIK